MKIIQWKEEFSVGNPLMDTHHRLFLNMVHELNETVSSGKQVVDKEAVLSFLTEYLDMHLRAEERLMKEIGFPDAEAHEATHHEFENKIHEMDRAFKQDPNSLRLNDLFEVAQEWLITHILKEDKQYQPYVNGE